MMIANEQMHGILTVQEALRQKLWLRHDNDDEIPIDQMVDEYLLAVIAMINRGTDKKGRRVPENRILWLPVLEAEARKRELEIVEDGWDK
jgi:hypothetical protein